MRACVYVYQVCVRWANHSRRFFPLDKRLPCDLLHAAASGGHHYAVALLLETRRIDVDGLVDGTSALWVASQQGHVQVVKSLVEFGVNVNLRTPDGRTPLYVVRACGGVQRRSLACRLCVVCRVSDVTLCVCLVCVCTAHSPHS